MTTYTFRQSEVRKYMRCPRSWWLNYRKDGAGYEQAPGDKPLSGQRDIGTLVHSALEAYYTGGDPVAFIHQAQLEHIEAHGDILQKEWNDVYVLAQIMVRGYVEWLQDQGSDAGEETLYVEKHIEIPVGRIRGDDIFLTGRIDRIARDKLTGEIIIEDFKTVQTLDQVGAQLQVDNQGLIYAILVQAGLNLPVRRFRHTSLRKVKRTKTATPPFYGRHEVSFNEEQLTNAWTHLMLVLDRMVESLQTVEKGEMFHHISMYPNPTKDCGWDCGHLVTCSLMDDGSSWQQLLSDSGIYRRREVPTA